MRSEITDAPNKLTIVSPTNELEFKVGQRQNSVPSGEYRVKVAKISKETFLQRRPVLHFTFVVVEGEYAGTQVRGFVNANYESFSAYTKLYSWFVKVAREEPEPGESINLSIFYDKVLLVKVEDRKSKKTKNNFSNVTDILAVVMEL